MPLRVPSFIVATAGHVDHGKSALVLALTGTDPDRLPEEKSRGITIDLGFAHLELQAPPANRHGAERYSCGMVDVPGHEDFVRNMVAGVGSIDLALLVVAADDGWMPQTEEHLQILLYLGVTRAVVALTKADLVPAPGPVAERIRAQLSNTAFADAPIVPTSVILGTGLAELRAALASALSDTPAPLDIGRPRLWADRVFVLRGVGTVVTGTLTGGVLQRGDEVVAQPAGQPSRIRNCHTHGMETGRVEPGMRVALNLPDLSASSSDPISGVRRGAVITVEASGPSVDTLDVAIERSPRLARIGARSGRTLRDGAQVHLHLGSAHVPARLQWLAAKEPLPGQSFPAQLRLERPTFAFAGDRFILRDPAQQTTLAGGVVLDPDARRGGARQPQRLRLLEQCAAKPGDPRPFVLLTLQRAGIAAEPGLLLRSRFPPANVAQAVESLAAAGAVVRVGGFVAPADRWHGWIGAAAHAIDECHRAHPDRPGLGLTELRDHLAQRHAFTLGFEALIASLSQAGFAGDGSHMRRPNHSPPAPALTLAKEAALILARLRVRPLDPPARSEIAPDPGSRQLLRELIQSRQVIELGSELLLESAAYLKALETVRDFLERQGQASAGQLRAALGTTRRVIIPLLERFDREGWTIRQGDLRSLRSGRQAGRWTVR